MLTTSIVLVLIGVMAIICGEEFFTYMLQIIGALITVSGLAMLIVRFAKKTTDSTFQKVVMASLFVCSMVCGVLIFYFAEELSRLFAIVIGAIVLLGAIMMIIINLAYHVKDSKSSRVYLILTIVILLACAAVGVMFIKNPDFGSKVMAITLGALMIALGLLFCLESFKVRKSIKEFNKNEELPEAVEDAEIIEETPNN